VITNTSRSWGGNEQYALQVAEGLAGCGHAVFFVWSDPVVGDRVRRAGLPNARLRLRADADLLGFWQLARLFRRQRADVVLLTKWREYWLGGLAAKLAGVRRTVLRLGLLVRPRADLKRRLIFRLADNVIVNAAEIREALLTRTWIAPEKVQVIHNGIDLERFRPGGDRQAFRETLGIPSQAQLVVAVGALTPQKDHALLVRAMALVRHEVPDVHLAIIGEGFLRAQIEAVVQELDLAACVHLPGFFGDVRPALAASDLFVLSSLNEGMARSLLEAMACGLPVVTTDVSGARSCVQPERNGLVVPCGDAGKLAEAIVRLLSDRPRRCLMGAESRKLAAANFAAENMLADTLRVLAGAGR
jgi:glycosyltransferase involved in cell wall biosynthesis